MTQTWNDKATPDPVPIGMMGWMRAILRGSALATLVFGCLMILLLVRLVEKPLFGLRRPITPYITQFVCRNAFRVMGLTFRTTGNLMKEHGVIVSNHVSWLDIFALNARKRIYFVSKSEVANWPGIGWLARATGTLFIERNPAKAREQTQLFKDRLAVGHKLLFFPEGTSTDGMRVLPFKTTLFAALFSDEIKESNHVQPVTLVYRAPDGEDAHFYGWWGEMEFADHLLKTLSVRRNGAVEVIYHPKIKVSDFDNRKALAAYCETQVRDCLDESINYEF